MIAILLCAALILGGGLLYRHFVTDRVADWGGMMNPDVVDMTVEDTTSADQETGKTE